MNDIDGMLAFRYTLESALARFQEIVTSEAGREAVRALAARPAINDEAHRRASSKETIGSTPGKNGDTTGAPVNSDGECLHAT